MPCLHLVETIAGFIGCEQNAIESLMWGRFASSRISPLSQPIGFLVRVVLRCGGSFRRAKICLGGEGFREELGDVVLGWVFLAGDE